MKPNDCPYIKNCSIQDCDSSCIRYREMRYLIDNSYIPPLYANPFPVYPQNEQDKQVFIELTKIKNDIVNFVSNGGNIFICSRNTGVGKTTFATKMLLKYFDRIWSGNGFRTRGVFVHVPTLLLQLKDFSNPLSVQYKKDIMETDLVIWDDIATSSLSEYDYNQLLLYIEYRINNKKANIFTSNITDKSYLEKIIGGRLTSRIYNSSRVYELTGKDYRNGSNSNNK